MPADLTPEQLALVDAAERSGFPESAAEVVDPRNGRRYCIVRFETYDEIMDEHVQASFARMGAKALARQNAEDPWLEPAEQPEPEPA